MRRLASAAAFAAALSAAGGAFAGDAGQWYVQGGAGVGFSSALDAAPGRSGDAGWAVSGQVGRELGGGWRADGEVLYLDARNRDHLPGRTEVVGGFVNGYYNFNDGKAWQPFVGAGIGAADVISLSHSATGFAYQVKAGLDHPLTDRLTGEIAYRFVGVTGLGAGPPPTGFHGDYHSSAVTLGLRYRFGG